MSIEILFALAVIALVLIILFVVGFGLELVRKEHLARDGAILLSVSGFVLCGLFFLYPLGG